MPGTEILVVDDNHANILAIRATLEPMGFSLVEASSGREALRLLLDRDFSLILLDVQMPGLDGFETARLIRSRPRTQSTPIIFVTAFGQDERDVMRGYELGAVDFMFKPIVPEVLRAKATVFVDLQRRTAEAEAQAQVIRDLERAAAARRLASERQQWEAERLRAESQRKDEFLAMLAHELRNPLSPLSNGLQVLTDGVDDTLRPVVAPMRRQLDHLVRLVDDLLDLARVSQGKISLEQEALDLGALVEHTVGALQPSAEAREHRLRVEAPRGLWVCGDAVRLSQVVQNLVTNAIRYTDVGGRIDVRVEGDDDRVTVAVVDNGRGIGEDLIDDVFELFVQERGHGEGLGLGLNLVKRLVTMHDGEVSAESPGPGQGATFRVALTRVDAPVETDDAEPSPPPEAPVDDGGCRVLLVDDNDDILTTTRFVLEAWGHEVVATTEGTEAIQLAAETRFDLALVDITMPVMDGFTVARHLRALDHCPRLVAVTGHADPSSRRRIQEAGFDAHLTKPADLSELESLLRSPSE